MFISNAVATLIAHYGSTDVAWMNIIDGDAPVNADPVVMDAWNTMHTHYDTDDMMERTAMARLFHATVDGPNA